MSIIKPVDHNLLVHSFGNSLYNAMTAKRHILVMKIPIEQLPTEWLPGKFVTHKALNELMIKLKRANHLMHFSLDISHVGYLPNYIARSFDTPIVIHKITHLVITAGAYSFEGSNQSMEKVRKIETMDGLIEKYWFTWPPIKYNQLLGKSYEEISEFLDNPDNWFIQIYQPNDMMYSNIYRFWKNYKNILNKNNQFQWEHEELNRSKMQNCIHPYNKKIGYKINAYCKFNQHQWKGAEMITGSTNKSLRLINYEEEINNHLIDLKFDSLCRKTIIKWWKIMEKLENWSAYFSSHKYKPYQLINNDQASASNHILLLTNE